MKPQEPDEDTDAMPANLGTQLGKNLGKKDNDEVWLEYRADQVVKYDKKGVKKKEYKLILEMKSGSTATIYSMLHTT